MAPLVGIIGAGNVGITIGNQLSKKGRSIVYGSRNPSRKQQEGSAVEVLPLQEAVRKAEVLILAVPGTFMLLGF
jgi:predicted dinucleotide-binding enzyme